MQESFHTPVLLHEAVKYLVNENLKKQIIVDGTLGGGGYTKLISEKIGKEDIIISIDKDLNALEYSKKICSGSNSKIIFINGNFGELKKILKDAGINKITGLVLDLGLSSFQLEFEDGFSFMRDTKLDMRADSNDSLTAAEIMNHYSKAELKNLFENYGEIGNAERLAKAIIEKRKSKKFEMTFDITELIKDEYKISKKDLAGFLAKIFQALRIEVNNELENLKHVLNESVALFEKGGRLVVISYHSLEDRIVKNFFKYESQDFKVSDNPFYNEKKIPALKILTKKPVVPSAEEIRFNTRSRSAKLRAAEIL